MTQASLIADSKPRANRTAEVHLALRGTDNESASKKVTFPSDSTLVGVSISVSALGVPGAGLRRPSLDDVMVQLDSTELKLTRQESDFQFHGYVTATALDVSERYMVADLRGATDISVSCRWKNPSNIPAVYEDSIVSIAFLYDTEGK